MENNQLFRQKSLDRISSPEEMHDYMRVTSPRLWMILTAIVTLLAGFIAFASTTRMENTIPIKVTVESYGEGAESRTIVSANLPLSQKASIETGMEVRIGNEKGKVLLISVIAESEDLYVLFEMEHEIIPLPEGEHDAVLVLESTTPISFLWNK